MKQSIIFIHGFRGNHLGLEALASAFPKKSFDIYIPDLPPAGGHDLKEYSAIYYARFIADYIKKNKLKNPVLVGHSMGSIIAAAAASRYPELIADKVIFLSPISVHPKPIFSLLSPFSICLPNKFVGYTTTKYMFIPKNKELLREVLEKTYACGADYVSRSAILKSARFSTAYCVADFDFDKTALFISGEKDRLIPLKKTKEVAKNYNAKSIVIKNTGHLLNYEGPKAVAREIKKFLKENS